MTTTTPDSASLAPDVCPCGSARAFDACCGPYIAGDAVPATAEALMRSRYSAYARENIDYLFKTGGAAVRDTFSRKDALEWARAATFTRLDLTEVDAGGPDDEEGVVAFAAHYTERNRARVVRERSKFVREEGVWRYAGAASSKTVVRDEPKVGRNDPCPCGSGKKFKKCHGR